MQVDVSMAVYIVLLPKLLDHIAAV